MDMDKKQLQSLDPLKKHNKKPKERIYVRVPHAIKEEIMKRANKRDVSFNAYIVHVIVDYFAKNQ